MGYSDPMRRASLIPLLIALLPACGEGLQPSEQLLDFGTVYLPYNADGEPWRARAALQNTSAGEHSIDGVTVPSMSAFAVLSEFPAAVPADVSWPVDFSFLPAADAFGTHEEMAVVDVSPGSGAPYTVAIQLRANFVQGDVDGDGFVDVIYEGGDDCLDSDPTVHPGHQEICDGLDNDCLDGPGATETDSDNDGVLACDGDCDDSDPLVHPGADEGCDGDDTDCDGVLGDDEIDLDGDGITACSGDCAPADAAVHPGAEESCDGQDTDCSHGGGAAPDEGDADGDGYRLCADDCDDSDATAHPGQPEACDGIDTDCDGVVSGNEFDFDGDGQWECEGDCDDTDALVYAGATEFCDGKDSDCNGVTPSDEGDDDADGVLDCEDCAPNDPDIFPGQAEYCDGIDNDCDLGVDEGFDADADGYTSCNGDCYDAASGVHPSAVETCDGVDQDCDERLLRGEDVDGDSDGQLDCQDTDCPQHVATVAVGSPDGSAAAPWPSLSAAMAGAAADGCFSLQLASGTYAETVDFGTSPWRLTTAGAPELVIIDGGGVGPVVTIAGGQDRQAGLVGLTVSGGANTGNGGLVYASGTSPTLSNCVFAGGHSSSSGGAVYSELGAPLVEDSEFRLNHAGLDGGGLMVTAATDEVVVRGNRFSGNDANDDGGGVYVYNSILTFENNVIDDNFAGDRGGGMAVDNTSNSWLRNNLIDGNSAANGGGVHFLSSAPFFENNAVLDNHATTPGEIGGVRIFDGHFRNNIIAWGTGYGVEVANQPLVGDFHYNDVFGFADGNYFGADHTGTDNNISQDPQFTAFSSNGDPDDDDLVLQAGSPCVDAGQPSTVFYDDDGSVNDLGIYGGPLGSRW